ncbi:YceI family protein [Pseudoxanthomonas beigongshangi]
MTSTSPRHRHARTGALFALLAIACPALARGPVAYALDPVHTRVMFAVEHAGFSQAIGTVSGSTGTLVFDPDDWTTARLDVAVPLARADLGDAKWNQAVLAGNLLDAERFPEARFISSRVEPAAPDHATVCGTLTLHGVSRELCLDVKLNAIKRHPLPPFRRTAGFSATTSLQRSDFGITAWKSVIGDTVALRIEAEATRTGKADDSEDGAASAAPAPATPREPTLHDPEEHP